MCCGLGKTRHLGHREKDNINVPEVGEYFLEVLHNVLKWLVLDVFLNNAKWIWHGLSQDLRLLVRKKNPE